MVFEEAVELRFAFPRSILPAWVRQDRLLCIRTKGDSMEATLNDGDLILSDYSRTNPLDDQIFLLRDDDRLVGAARRTGLGLNDVQKYGIGGSRIHAGRFSWPDDAEVVGELVWGAVDLMVR